MLQERRIIKQFKEAPRRRIYRLRKQIAHWRCYGYCSIAIEQDICIICQHCTDSGDCIAGITTNQDTVSHCRRFKAIKDWRYITEGILTQLMGEIIGDMCSRETEYKAKAQMSIEYNSPCGED